MYFSLSVQRYEVSFCKVRKEKTPGVKPFSSFTSSFSGTAKLTGILPAQTCCTSFPKNTRSHGAFQRINGTL